MDNIFKDHLEGDFIYLRKIEPKDAELVYKWRSSKSGRFLRMPPNYSIESQRKWIETRTNLEINYIIVCKSSNIEVGTISICDLNFDDMVGDVGRLLLDEKYLNVSTPYGLESLSLCYDYLFNILNFRKTTGVIAGVNSAMIKLQLFLGMYQEGVLKSHTKIGDEFADLYLMSMFEKDFNTRYKAKINFLLKNFKKDK